jgi:hypothetical protein
MTDQKQGSISPDDVKQKVASEVEVKTPPTTDVANQEAPILEKTEVPKTGDAPDDWDE